MYERRVRSNKAAVQNSVREWLDKISLRYRELREGVVITLAGSDVINAVNAVSGINPREVLLYEKDSKTWNEAFNTIYKLRKQGEFKNVYLDFQSNIHSRIHDECNCFYYDFCATYKSIDWAHIAAEFKNQMNLGNSFSVVYTLSLRGASLKDTKNFIKDFNETLLSSNSSYVIKKMKKIYTYHGGPNGYGSPMLVWAAVFLKGDHMSKSLREKHPALFGLEQPVEQTEEKKEMVMKRTRKTKETHKSTDVRKEMVHVLLSKKNREYTNQDIADMTGMSLRQVASMAAWHNGKLAAKRK